MNFRKNKSCVSVVVCAYNEEKLLAASLNSLVQLNYESDCFEIIIINDDSSDDTEAIGTAFKEKHKGQFDITYKKIAHGGLSVARNEGIKLAKYKLIAFIDGDALAERNWLRELVAEINSHPHKGIVGGVVENLDRDTKFGRFIHHFHYLPLDNPANADITDVIGTNMMYRSEVFESLGGFYNVFDRRGDESTVNKLASKKFSFSINPKAIVFHERPTDVTTWLEMRRQNGYYGYMSENVVASFSSRNGFFIKNIYLVVNSLIHMTFPIMVMLYPLIPLTNYSCFLIPGIMIYIKRYLFSNRMRKVISRMETFQENSFFITLKALFLYYLGSLYQEVGWIQASFKMPFFIVTDNKLNIE